MAKGEGAQICWFIILVLSVGFFIWGLMDLLKKQQADEPETGDVISRQIRGFAYIMISQVVLVLGGALCYGKGQGKGLLQM